MSLLISVEDIKNWEQLPAHRELWQRIQIRIKQAQDFDLPKIINLELINDLIANISSTEQKWIDLRLKVNPVMVYFSYARFLEWHNLNIEAFGISKVGTTYSDKLTNAELEAKISRAKSLANGYGSQLITFLEEAWKADKTTYPNYKRDLYELTSESMTFRIKPVG